MKTTVRKIALMLMSCTGLMWMHSAAAVDVQIKITGEIHIPPCRINNDTEFRVSFGTIALQKVDGQNFKESRTVNVSCDYYQGKPYIRLDGAVLPGAADNVLQTSGANASSLGIALYQGNDVNPAWPLRIGAGEQGQYGFEIKNGLTAINAQNSQFTFTAVPYKQGGADLKAGSFSAAATMSISYL